MERLVPAAFYLLFALLVGAVGLSLLMQFKKLNKALKEESRMIGVTDGKIVELVVIRRREVSRYHRNYFPILEYEVNGKMYRHTADYMNRIKDRKYEVGDMYQIRYVPDEPEICIVDRFYKTMKSTRTVNLIVGGVLAWFAIGCIFQAVSVLLFGVPYIG